MTLPDSSVLRIAAPARSISAEYGRYLVDISGCRTCHQEQLHGGKHPDPNSPPVPNLTPAGKIANWPKGEFIHTMRTGVTPDGSFLNSEDISASIIQYGDKTTITDRIMDTHEDNILREAVDLLGEQLLLIAGYEIESVDDGHCIFCVRTNLTVAEVDLLQNLLTQSLQQHLRL
jgi:hypothetical protein